MALPGIFCHHRGRPGAPRQVSGAPADAPRHATRAGGGCPHHPQHPSTPRPPPPPLSELLAIEFVLSFVVEARFVFEYAGRLLLQFRSFILQKTCWCTSNIEE